MSIENLYLDDGLCIRRQDLCNSEMGTLAEFSAPQESMSLVANL